MRFVRRAAGLLILALAGLNALGGCGHSTPPAEPESDQAADELSLRLPPGPLVVREGRLVDANGNEVALFGVNFQTPISWEYKFQYRAAGIPLEGAALNRLTDEHLRDLLALRADVVRVHLASGDLTDSTGNLRASPYLDALEHLLARCNQLGLGVYLTLINEQGAAHFADSFMAGVKRDQWLVDRGFLQKAQVYITALLNHKNPKTGRLLKDEPSLLLLEPVNEPAYPKALEGRKQVIAEAVASLHRTIRATGARQPVVWNLNWPGMMWNHKDVFEAVAESPVEAVSFCLYPGTDDLQNQGSNFWDFPVNLSANNYFPYLRKVLGHECELGWALSERFRGKAKLVYEFETMFNQSAYMYPAMAAVFRQLGVQVACMWHYRLLPAALLQGGTHYLNRFTTPRKALAFEAASLVFHGTPLLTPARFESESRMAGQHWFSDAAADLAVFDDGATWISTNVASEPGDQPFTARQTISGWRGTPWITFEGSGAFSCRRTEDGWRLTIGPDVEFFREFWVKAPNPRDPLCRLIATTPHTLKLRIDGIAPDNLVLQADNVDVPQVSTEGGWSVFRVTPGDYSIHRREPGSN